MDPCLKDEKRAFPSFASFLHYILSESGGGLEEEEEVDTKSKGSWTIWHLTTHLASLGCVLCMPQTKETTIKEMDVLEEQKSKKPQKRCLPSRVNCHLFFFLSFRGMSEIKDWKQGESMGRWMGRGKYPLISMQTHLRNISNEWIRNISTFTVQDTRSEGRRVSSVNPTQPKLNKLFPS